jgi:hypothetical protein
MISSANAGDLPVSPERAMVRIPAALLLVAVLTALRIATAAFLPLSFDESYFWLWSKRLAISYFEHPPLIAFAIRAGTTLLGDTELGVRLAPLCASVAASWAVWRAGTVLFAHTPHAWTACVYFNITLMVASQGMAATPDIFVMAAAAFLLLAIAELQRTQDGRWWVGAGLALGVAMLAKYTAFFLGLSVCLWTFATPQGRRWLKSPWLYAAALVALICLLPNLVWNEAHGWMSFKYQFGRVVAGKVGIRHIFEFVGAQLALGSPAILLLAGIGLVRASHRIAWSKPIAIAVALVWPAILYFAIHGLHDRVQGNWPSFIYPALAILAASVVSDGGQHRFVGWCQRLALPIAGVVLAVSYVQTWTGLLPLGNSDPIARMTAVGLEPVTQDISSIARSEHAIALVTTRYVTSGWLAFYVRPHLPVLQTTEGYRWSDAPAAPPTVLHKPLLYVTQHPERELREIAPYFSQVILKGCVPRMRNGVVIDTFCIYSLGGFRNGRSGLHARFADGDPADVERTSARHRSTGFTEATGTAARNTGI